MEVGFQGLGVFVYVKEQSIFYPNIEKEMYTFQNKI